MVAGEISYYKIVNIKLIQFILGGKGMNMEMVAEVSKVAERRPTRRPATDAADNPAPTWKETMYVKLKAGVGSLYLESLEKIP